MRDSPAIRLIAFVALVIALSLGARLFVPLTLGLILAGVLHPVVGSLHRARVPTPLGATVAVLVAIVGLVLAVMLLEPPVRAMAAEIPKTLVGARRRLESLGVHFPGAVAAADSTRREPQQQPPPAQGGSGQSPPGGLMQAASTAFGVTTGAIFALVEILLLAFFILAAGDRWRDKLRDVSPTDAQRQRALDTMLEIRRVVNRYLLMNVIINAVQAVLVGVVVWVLGYPTPLLWAVLTFIAEFIPYFGGATLVVLLLLSGLAQGRGLGHAVIGPLLYLLISTLQNNLVSPAAYGRGLKINPTAILVGVMFWGVVWGIAGVFLAVPLLAAVRIIAEQSETWRPVAVFLAD
jgi:predicted PurR-regulated permease PerM